MLDSQLQRSAEWYTKRLGRFTSSRIHELLGVKGLGKTGESYAFELAVELVQGKNFDDDFTSFDMQRGIELEPIAFDKFAELKELEFVTVEKCGFFELNKDTGGSPDGIVSDNSVLEIKCPKANKFFRLVCDEVIDPCYVDQMQHQMWVTASERAYFFNYLIYNGVPLWHEIVVSRDEERISLIKSRINEAAIMRDDFVNQILEKRQWQTYEAVS